MLFLFTSLGLILFLILIFNLTSKNSKWEKSMSSTFECGFSAYFYSRFSFSIHYFMVGLIFLFLDLELCYMMPMMNQNCTNLKMNFLFFFFIMVLILGVILEWNKGKMDWKF